jgi:outer membrane protein
MKLLNTLMTGATVALSATALVISLTGNKPRTVYIDTGRIYSEFKLSKELNAELESTIKARRASLDSLYRSTKQNMEILQKKAGAKEEELAVAAMQEQAYFKRERQVEAENQNTSLAYNDKIWNQLNQYIMDYGKEHGYSFILGANGQGNIMYGDKQNDLTEETIHYVNARYEGKTK